MTRSPGPPLTKDELRDMTVEELNAYIDRLRSELTWRAGPFLQKRHETAAGC